MLEAEVNTSLRGFYHAVLAAILSIMLLVLSWPWLVLNPLQPGRVTPDDSLVWDSVTRMVMPRQRLVIGDVTYDLTAQQITITDQDSQQVILDQPAIHARLTDDLATDLANDDRGYRTTAKYALFDRQAKILRLEQDVEFANAYGGVLHTEAADIMFDQAIVQGNDEIMGTLSPSVRVKAAGFRWSDSATPIKFLGPTVMRILIQEAS